MKPVSVKLDNRTFIVSFDYNDKPTLIKERKIHGQGTFYECWYNATYWSAKHHSVGSEKTIVSQILKKATHC